MVMKRYSQHSPNSRTGTSPSGGRELHPEHTLKGSYPSTKVQLAKEMKLGMQVQIMDMADWGSLYANVLEKGMNPSVSLYLSYR